MTIHSVDSQSYSIADYESEKKHLQDRNNCLKKQIRRIDPQLLNERREERTNKFVQVIMAIIYFIKSTWFYIFDSLKQDLETIKTNEAKIHQLNAKIFLLQQQEKQKLIQNKAHVEPSLITTAISFIRSTWFYIFGPLKPDLEMIKTNEGKIDPLNAKSSLLTQETQNLVQNQAHVKPSSILEINPRSLIAQQQFNQQIIALCVSQGLDETYAQDFATKFFPSVTDINIQPGLDPRTLSLDVTFAKNDPRKINYGFLSFDCTIATRHIHFTIDFDKGAIILEKEKFIAIGSTDSFALTTIKVINSQTLELGGLPIKGLLSAFVTEPQFFPISKKMFHSLFS